jgi:hypothetical protein
MSTLEKIKIKNIHISYFARRCSERVSWLPFNIVIISLVGGIRKKEKKKNVDSSADVIPVRSGNFFFYLKAKQLQHYQCTAARPNDINWRHENKTPNMNFLYVCFDFISF